MLYDNQHPPDPALNDPPRSANTLSLNNRPLVLGLLTFIILALLSGNLVYQRFVIRKENRRDETREAVITAKEKLQELLAQSASATKTLAFFVQPDGSVKDFDGVASQVLAAYPSINMVELLPDGVIRYISPLRSNESALGYDVLHDPLHRTEALRAINKKEFFFAGPVQMKQGGIGVAGRLPVFRNNKFWGFSEVLINMPTLLKATDIDTVGNPDYAFQLSKINANTGAEENLLPEPADADTQNIVRIKYGSWRLSARPLNTKNPYLDIFLVGLFGLLFSIMGGWLVYVIAKRPQKLNELVNKRTTELQNSEAKYRSLIEQASDGIVMSDLRGIIQEVNRSMCLMGGYQMEEMLGRPINDFLPSADLVGKPLRIDELIKGTTLHYERRLRKKDGRVVEIEVTSKMATASTLIGVVRDITERKRAEEKLKRSNERFELIAKATNDAIWDYDPSEDATTGNENLYNLYGMTAGRDSINLEAYLSRLHPDDLERVVENYRRSRKEKAIALINEFRFKLPNGTYKHFYERAYIKYNDKGKPDRIVGVMQDISARIENRQRLIREKELSDSIINSLPAVFYLYNQEGRFLRWNKNFEEVTGYTADEISHLHPLVFFDEKEKTLLTEKIENVFLAGQDTVQANLLSKNGRQTPYYFTGLKIDYEGETCLMGFGVDFSDKVRSDNLIRESEEKFRGLVEQAAEGVVILSPEGQHQYASPSIETILNYTEEDMMKLNAFDLTHPDDRAELITVFGEVMNNPGVPIKGNMVRIKLKDGSWRWMEFTFTNMLAMPSINGIVGNFRDITEKLEAEKKLINEKFLSDSIINSLPGIFYLYDYTGHFIRWNKNFEIVTGYNSEEIAHMHPLDFYRDDIKPAVAERIENVLRKKMPSAEFSLLTRDGREIPFFYNSISIDYEGVRCVAGMGFDITERKKMDEDLRVSHAHLEQAAAELKASNAELERFAYIVSHDLQEPLRMITSFLKLLEQKYQHAVDETGRKYIFFAVDGARRMRQLIMDLLEYSRTGTENVKLGDTDMNEVVKDVLLLFENSIKEQGAVIEVEELPILLSSSKIQMTQLIQNLVSNALKYHSDQKPHIRISAVDQSKQWLFAIQDNGIGIDSKFFERIFTVFQRLHNKNEYSGSGIGLSICKKIVERYGGRIWLESNPGKGTTFYFSLPKKGMTRAA